MTDKDPVVPDHPTMLAAMRLACRAPSVHNTQPWRWVFDGTRLRLYTDTDRQLLATDPRGRQQLISCGAGLHHLRSAFAAYHWHTDTVRLPDPAQPQHLATVEFRPWPDPPDGIRARTDAIDRRYTDRLPMLEPQRWDDIVHTLRKLVSPHEIELDVLDESARARLSTASEQSAALRRYDMQYQAELQWWTGHREMPEGIPPTSMVSDADFARVGVGRAFPPVPHSMRRAEIEDRARLVVLSSTDDSAMQWLHTGEALSVLLLECTAAGLNTCALTHITEVPAGRRLLAGLTAYDGLPQVVVRIGTAPDDHEPPPTPRRPLTDVFTTRRG
ncbi:hypothetical protein [Nocardia sp. CS682]|uniref:Acg family FMN-binding oxidoreductase n=1 Tax=Nocardia sp. CS682 TaxID=1047172 RepID=UPI001075851A|nr:hypothetical protein [Nocardia sp. CS682]QBS39308.1 hypothetical protein DMB37_03405 [Nocardia sp. CS682]